MCGSEQQGTSGTDGSPYFRLQWEMLNVAILWAEKQLRRHFLSEPYTRENFLDTAQTVKTNKQTKRHQIIALEIKLLWKKEAFVKGRRLLQEK